MEGEYDVCLDREAVGKVQVSRKGLYYRIICRCRLSGDSICRLAVKNGEIQESLGIPVPVGDCFLLEKMIPVKKIGEGKLEFFLISPKGTPVRTFVPLCPEEPFRYIERLKNSYLAERNGRIGVMVP